MNIGDICNGCQLAKQLGLGVSTQQRPMGGPALPPAAGRALGRFLLPLSECEFALESAIDDLQVRLSALAALCLLKLCWYAAPSTAQQLI